MNFRNASLVILTLLLAIFSWQNWPAIRGTVDPETGALAVPSRFLWLDLAVAPGLVLLGTCALLALLYLAYTTQVRTSGLVESRRWAREVEAARKLADEAEASRFEQLRGDLDARFGSLEDGLRSELNDTHNVLVAHLTELDERLSLPAPQASTVVDAPAGEAEATGSASTG
jgi:hypothetical protein